MKQYRSGIYAWGGPGTIRLLRSKYHSPEIDEASFLSLYDSDKLRHAKKSLHLSDAWVTYSWGFSDAREQEDYAFIRSRLSHFKKLGIKTHGYVQGLNVVETDFHGGDLFCADEFGRRIPYSRGRKLTCPNNPNARQLIVNRVLQCCAEDFDGVYLDNMLFGLPPVFIRSDFAPFFGCNCLYCREEFLDQFSVPLVFPLKSRDQLTAYLQFRTRSMQKFIHDLSSIVRANNKEFGINLYDPVQMNAPVYFGYELQSILSDLDYLMIENHSLPTTGRSNTHLQPLIASVGKPVFIISYGTGIGKEPAFGQHDFNAIASEAKHLGYFPCYKFSEFTTDGIWHAQDVISLQEVRAEEYSNTSAIHLRTKILTHQWYDLLLAWFTGFLSVPLLSLYFENRLFNRLGERIYFRAVHAWKDFEI